MSERSSGDDIRQRCVFIILKNSLGEEASKFKELAQYLQDEGIIETPPERKAIFKLAQTEKFGDAIQQMISKAVSSEKGLEVFVDALTEEDLKVEDKRFSEILAVTLDPKNSNDTRTKLISLWNELESFQQDVEQVVHQLWPDHLEMTAAPWPLQFIHFCATNSDVDSEKVEEFVSAVNFLTPGRKSAPEAKNGEGVEDQPYFEETSIDNPHGSLEPSLDSFVVIPFDNEDGTEEHDSTLVSNRSCTNADPPLADESRSANTEEKPTTNPLLASTDSQEMVNRQMEEAMNTEGSSTPSVTNSPAGSVYVSEENSLTTSVTPLSPGTEVEPPTEPQSPISRLSTNSSQMSVSQQDMMNKQEEVALPDEPLLTSTTEKTSNDDIPTVRGTTPLESGLLTVADQSGGAQLLPGSTVDIADQTHPDACPRNEEKELEKKISGAQSMAQTQVSTPIDETSAGHEPTPREDADQLLTRGPRGDAQQFPDREIVAIGRATDDRQTDEEEGKISDGSLPRALTQDHAMNDENLTRNELLPPEGGGDEHTGIDSDDDEPPSVDCRGIETPISLHAQQTEAEPKPGAAKIAFEEPRTKPPTPAQPGVLPVQQNSESDDEEETSSDENEDRTREAPEGMVLPDPTSGSSESFGAVSSQSDECGWFYKAVENQPRSLTEDGELADRMQLHEALVASREPNPPNGNSFIPVQLNRFWNYMTSKTAKMKVEFRVHIDSVPRQCTTWMPAVYNTSSRTFVWLQKHRMGYWYANIETSSSKLKYYYTLYHESQRRCNDEWLPQQKRVVDLSGDMVTLDVATFKKSDGGKWRKMIERHMKAYLPAPDRLFNPRFQLSYANVLYWIEAAQRGWKVIEPRQYFFNYDKKDIQQILKDWLASIEKSSNASGEHAEKHVLCSLEVVVALDTLELPIGNPKLFTRLCKGLRIHHLKRAEQLHVYQSVYRRFCIGEGDRRMRQHILEALNFFIGNISKFRKLSCLLTLPLYQMIYRNGDQTVRNRITFPNLLYDRAMLPSIEESKWSQFRSELHRNKWKKLQDFADTISEISQVHGWIVDTYQYFLSADMLIELIRKRHQLADKFQLDSVFKQILPLLEPHGYSNVIKANRRKVVDLSSYLDSRFAKLSNQETIRGLTEFQRVLGARSACLIGETLQETLSKVLRGSYSTGERNSISWIISMATNSTNLFQALNVPADRDQSPHSFFDKIFEMIKCRISEYGYQQPLPIQEIEFYNNLFCKSWIVPTFQEDWSAMLENEIKSVLENEWGEPKDGIKFFRFYLETLSKVTLHDRLDFIFTVKSESAAKDILMYHNNPSGLDLIGELKAQGGAHVQTSFANSFRKEYQNFGTGDQKGSKIKALKFLLTAPIVLRFYRVFDRQSVSQMFSKRQYSDVKKVHEIACSMLSDLSQGQLTMEEFELVLPNKKQSIELMSLTSSVSSEEMASSQKSTKEFAFLFDVYERDLAKYRTEMDALEFFGNFCKVLRDRKILVDCSKLTKIHGRKHSHIKLTELKKRLLGQEEMREVLLVQKLKGSHVLYRTIDMVAEKYNKKIEPGSHPGRPMKMDCMDVLKTIWEDIKASLLKFIKDVDKAQLLPEEITQSFSFTRGEESHLKKEIAILYEFADAALQTEKTDKMLEKEATVKARQLAQVFTIVRNQKTLAWFEDFRKKNHLYGDFPLLQEFQESFQGLDDAKFQKLSGILNIDQKQLDILMDFTKQQDLIDWIQSKMKEESNVIALCQVAVESTRYNPMQADKWSSLADVVAVFDALLFNLHKVTGLDELLGRCIAVWQKVGDEHGILRKWGHVGKDVAWYKKHEKLYGSEAQVALQFAEEVNHNGQYIVSKMTNDGATASLKNSIKLRLQRDAATPERENKSLEEFQEDYDIEYLHGIESTLTLISSDTDKKTVIKQFVAVLNAIKSLVSGYVELVNAGFMLLNDWKLVASCEKSRSTDMMTEQTIRLKIYFKSKLRPLVHMVSINDMNLLASILRETLERWTHHISQMRLKHYFLNEYSIQQIKYLCGELGKVRQGTLEEEAYLLLSDWPKNEMTPMIHDSLNKAMATHEEEEAGNGNNVADDSADVSKEVALSRKKRQAVRNLVNVEDASETVAKAAVQALGAEDLTACATWIMLNEFDEDLVNENSRLFDQEAGFVCDTNDVQEDFTILQDRSARTLDAMISILLRKAEKFDLLTAVKTIFTGYLTNTTTSTLKDCLSVNHFGKFLTILHNAMETKSKCCIRNLPPNFNKGKPNFILAQQHHAIPLVLSLYASSALPEEEQKLGVLPELPSSEVVLLCSETTKEDEVERFMHKALRPNPTGVNPLFCMVFTEKLNFNASKTLETVFEKLSQEEDCRSDYQLVIVSSDPQHFASIGFYKYLQEKPDFDTALITRYVEEHMSRETSLRKKKVSVVTSRRSGVGKSLYVKRIKESLPQTRATTTVRLFEKNINLDKVLSRLFEDRDPVLIHIDLTPAVENGIEKFLFDLLILGVIRNSTGKVWRKNRDHCYVIEVTNSTQTEEVGILKFLPTTECLTPNQVLDLIMSGRTPKGCVLMDEGEFSSDVFQRPYQYLIRKDRQKDITGFNFEDAKKQGHLRSDQVECLQILLKYCGIDDPTWMQLKHFVSFLDVQLQNCEKSVYCHVPELKGLKKFAVKFMITMAQDFATPSLVISDESGGSHDLEGHQIRRKWEEQEHPYVFFNDDGETMTFVNVNIDKYGNLRDKDGKTITQGFISKELVKGLFDQEIDLGHRFQDFTRSEMLLRLCRIMGIELPPDPNPLKSKKYVPVPYDPDPTYELTTDNVLKMIAIYMRFRCNIPVIIMGETGCGKTRMIEFMSKLQEGPSRIGTSMKTLKVHGGITVENIFQSVKEAIASPAKKIVLFYDEANTTTAIHAIKEVMCDFTVDGRPLRKMKPGYDSATNFQVVAACNPYKKLSKEALKKLESCGLGYRVATTETNERLGNTPMRELVYKVVALPPSIQPFVWDFGQLSDETERIYIRKMVAKLKSNLELDQNTSELIVEILSRAQEYMKKQNDECRYVSLRDVERAILLYKWFEKHKECLFDKMDRMISLEQRSQQPPKLDISLRCLLQAVGIAYHVSLENRIGFRLEISAILSECGKEVSQYDILKEYEACQTVFHWDLKSEANIAWNEALRENVFLMAICTDLKLPLYLIGKPGSSKSLAKVIVEANMKGSASNSPLFRRLRKVEVFPFQCSALTTADGIKKIFKTAAERQKKNDLEKFTSLVVLDEIGLAEDSTQMPLKILHPLLESGNADTGGLTDYKEAEKVSFTGISNWALDPAKMNRGIFVTRGIPGENDLIDTARSIFQGNEKRVNENYTLLQDLTKTYLGVYKNQGDQYFGLRDYYSLIKMIRSMFENKEEIGNEDEAYILARNFSGGKQQHTDALKQSVAENLGLPEELLSQSSLRKLVLDNLESPDSRFLLLLTAQHSSLNLIQYIMTDLQEVQVIFGSSFPGDHTYTQLCRSINQIKVCMEKGKTAIMLNMTDIHESLYDVLNQHFVTFGDQRYVAIGLGSHRVWSRIDKNFRLIVIEERRRVHDNYPIPLINRLEKHHLLSRSLLTPEQAIAEKNLVKWSNNFAQVGEFNVSNAFIGYHEDVTSSVVLAHSDEGPDIHEKVMLQTATAESIYRLAKSKMRKKQKKIMRIYMEEQVHDSLYHLLQIAKDDHRQKLEIFEVVSFSNILTEEIRKEIEQELNLFPSSVMLLFLQQFKVEEEYIKKLDDFFLRCQEEPKQKEGKEHQNAVVLLVQMAQAHQNGKMIECAKHNFMNKLADIDIKKMKTSKIIVAFISSTARCVQSTEHSPELSIQHTSRCKVVYIDELRHLKSNSSTTLISSFYDKSIADILLDGFALLDKSGSMDSYVLCLLQDCVSVAMAKVTNSRSAGQRKLERIQTLQLIMGQSEKLSKQIRQEFVKILLKKMMHFYQEDSQSKDLKIDWIVQEACSKERLQEGGTFGKTIHLYLKNCLADMLAFVISIVDENNNLSLLQDTSGMQWKWELWQKIFESITFEKTSAGKAEYSVKTVKHLNMDNSSKFPFSFIVTKELKEFYEEAQELARQSGNKKTYFDSRAMESGRLATSRILQVLNSENSSEMMEEYTHDLLKFAFKDGANNPEDLDALVKILFEYSKMIWIQEGSNSNAVAVAFYTFQEIVDHVSSLSSIFKICPDLIKNAGNWVLKQQENLEFQTHVYAMSDLISWCHEKATKLGDDKSVVEWMNVSTQMKKTYQSLLDTITCEDRKADMQEKYKPIALLDTLLTHLLPWDRNNTDYGKYATLVVEQAKKVFRAMETMGFHSKEVLKIVTTTMRKCHEDLKLSLIMDWRKAPCVCGKKILTPVKMPCGAFICMKCAEMIHKESNTCPRCTDPLSTDFTPIEPRLTVAHQRRLEKFQDSCTGFFLEYLYNYCFSATPVLQSNVKDREKVRAIFEGTISPQGYQFFPKSHYKLETTKMALNIASKSSIFNLLLRQSPEFLERELNEIFSKDFKDDTFVLVALEGIQKFERERKEKLSERDLSVDEVEVLNESWQFLSESTGKIITFEILYHVARLRSVLSSVVAMIEKRKASEEDRERSPLALLTMLDICRKEDADLLCHFVSKTGVGRHGTQWLHKVLSHEELKVFIKGQLREHVDAEFIDCWELLGRDYTDSKKAKQRMTSVEFLRMLQAKFMRNWRPNRKEKFILDQISKLDHRLDVSLNLTKHHKQALSQLAQLTAVVVLRKLPMMRELNTLLMNPMETNDWFWPAMPESLYDVITNVLTEEAAYVCPNGHPYSIGDCTYPDSTALCPVPTCRKPIGGILHIAAEGNQRLEQGAGAFCGYLLHKRMMGVDSPADRATEQASSVIQFFIHSCMLVAMKTDKNQILRMIQKDTEKDGYEFLGEALFKNLKGLSHGLGCNVDDAIIVLGTILSRMTKLDVPENSEEIPHWENKDSRKKWEKAFREQYLLSVFKDVDDVIFEGKRVVKREDGLQRFFKEDFTLAHTTERFTWTSPALWKFIKEPTVSHLLHQIVDSDLPGGVLRTILETPNLHFVSHLKNVLKLQDFLIQRYKNKQDMESLDSIKFVEIKRAGVGYDTIQLIDEYIGLWNQTFPILRMVFVQDSDIAQYMKKMDENSPITMAMPSARGRGKCAKRLAEYLIRLHNDFLNNCMAADDSIEKLAEVEVAKLLPSHFVCINKQHDLLPMVHLHCSYSIITDDSGLQQHHKITYDIPTLDKEAKERHVMYKKLIKEESLPCIKYAQDVGVGADWDEVKENVNQVPLTPGISQEVDDMVTRATLADVCEGVRTLAQAISFLAKVKVSDKEKKLRNYLESDLMLSATHLGMIPRAARICHTLALYQNLSCHKAVSFIQQGLNPYKECFRGEQRKITDPHVLAKLKESFEHTDLNSLRQHLNEVIIRNLDFKPNWSLLSIFPYLSFIEQTGTDSWYTRIPEEVQFQHVSDLFKLSVEGIKLPNEES